jgi:aryl-alcohol dehydrogenase-like predicted oxidoreductase
MIVRPLGSTGLSVSALGFGAGAIGREDVDEGRVERLLATAVEAGVTLFDAARSYGRAEARLGRCLRGRRSQVVLSTKGGYGVEGVADWTGDCIRLGIDRALVELGTHWIDVFHLHSCPREVASRPDILQAMADARRAGKIRVAGYAGDGEALAWAVESGQFGAVECSLNLLDQANAAAVARAVERGMGVIAKRPLANTAWTLREPPLAPDTRTYWERAQQLGVTPELSTALRFSAFFPGVASAIVGCSRSEHLQENLAAFGEGPLSEAALASWRARFQQLGGRWSAVV